MKHKVFVSVVLMVVLIFSIHSESASQAFSETTGIKEGAEIRAEITPMIGYQGRLFEDDAPVTGVRSMTFKLYNSVTAGTLIWSETKNVTVSNGMFHTSLGDTTPFSEAVRSSMTTSLWLEVSVGGTILPRQRMMGSPYAFTLAPGAIIDAEGPQYALNVKNDTTDGTGLYARGKNGIYASATTGFGVSAYSDSKFGVEAQSNGTGLNGAALKADALNAAGIAIWAAANSSDATLVSINEGSGPLFKAFGGDGGDEEFKVLNNGTVSQDLTATGLVKAAVNLYCNNSGAGVLRSFNNAGGYTIVTNGPSLGTCYIEFGIDLTNRFWTVSSTDPMPDIVQCEIAVSNSYKLLCHKWQHDGTAINGYMMVVLY